MKDSTKFTIPFVKLSSFLLVPDIDHVISDISTLKNTFNPYQLFTFPELKFDKVIFSHLFSQRCCGFCLILQK